nr:putative olfactory receptor 5AK3 [Vicugna pacos]
MQQNNGTKVTEFILLGFAGQHKSWHVLFVVFLVIYVVILVGSIGMILLIKIESSLHTPMYFFLQHLAFVDLCYASAITPKMLQNFVSTKQSISFIGCMVQLLVYGIFITSDSYILASMAVDRYVAICNPLHYATVMSQRVCIQLIVGSYFMGFLNACVNVSFTSSLNFCKSNKINHFFCDIPPILALSCSRSEPCKHFLESQLMFTQRVEVKSSCDPLKFQEGLVMPTHRLAPTIPSHQSTASGLERASVFLSVFLCQGHCDSVSQTGWLKQQKLLASQFCRLEVRNQGIGRTGSFRELREKGLFRAALLGWQMAVFIFT